MKRIILPVLLLVAMVTQLSCGTATVGASSAIKIPEDSAQQCTDHCKSIGMKLGAVAIMANTVGCVCTEGSAESSDESGDEGAASITAGMATIAMQQAAAAQRQQAAAAAAAQQSSSPYSSPY